MGADLCIQRLTWDQKRKLNWKAGEKFIKNLPADEKGNITGAGGGDYTKKGLLSDLKEIEEAIKDNRRDTTTFHVAHLNVMITGGMSWGDDPTDTYRSISNLSEFDAIFETIGFYKDNIDYKALLLKVLKTKNIAPLLIGIDMHLDVLIDHKLRRKHG